MLINDMKTNIHHLSFYLCIIMLLIMFPCQAFCEITPRLLILNSYHKEFRWTDAQVEAAKKVIKDEFPNAEIVVEYMDTKRIYDETYLDLLNRLYGLKYKNMKFDAIITTDDNALWFALDHREKLFKGSPISFCGINDYKASLIEASSQVSGIIEVLDIAPTIDLVLKIHPKTDRIVVVVDSTPTGIGQLREIKKAVRNYQNLVFEYLEGKNLSHEELFERLNALPENSVVLLTVWLRDRNNAYLPSEEGGRLISKNAKAPVYGIIDMYFGDGIVGGKLLSSSTHGRIAAEKALHFIQQKENSKAIQVTKSSMNPFMFDYEQLNRWNIDVSVLPQNSIIINEPFSLYKKYKRLVTSTLLVMFILATIIVFLIINILYRRKAESALKKSEENYKLLADNANDVIWVRDMDLKLIYVSPSVEKVRGYSVEEVKSQDLSEVLTPISAQKAVNLYLEMLKSGNDPSKIDNNISVELYHLCKDGSEICMECNISLMRDNSGMPVGILGVNRDISDRKRATEALRLSEEKFRSLYNLSPQAVALTEIKTGKLLDVNDKLCELTGYDKSFLIGKTNTEIGFLSEQYRELFIHELKSNGQVNGMEMEFSNSNNAILHTLVFAKPIIINRSELLLTIFNDITQQKHLEEQIQQTQKMESIGSLAGGIAHDFNNLLSPIVGLSEMMLHDFPPDSMERQNIREIYNAGTRGRELVQQILSFSRQSEHQLIPVHIQKILKEVLKLCRATIPADIPITQDIQTGCGQVMADPTQIHQIAMNLITNAYHAVESTGGTITVQLKETDSIHEDDPALHVASGRYAVLSVSDTGTGIDPAVMNKIFDPYFTTKEKGRGTGLGLATVYGIVKAHGGDIRVHSEVGKGSCFHVYLPVMEKSAEVIVPEKQQQALPTGTEYILLVDDEASILQLEKQMLERLGYTITGFTSSVDALAALNADASRFDLVITDMHMPNLNGMQLAEKLTAVRPEIPVIICTGFSERINKENAAGMGIKGFLMKPLGMMDLAHKIREVLD